MLSHGGVIGTKDGPKVLPCPVEYIVLRAVRYMNGAMQPKDFVPEYPVCVWAEYAVMSEKVEEEVQEKKQGPKTPGTNTIQIVRPPSE